jgi:uncharacterized membrane protein
MPTTEPFDLSLAAMVLMGLAALLMRVAGFWMMGYVSLTPRIRRMLEALPGSIVAAAVLPIAVKGGPVAMAAVAAALAVMILRRNELLAIAAGMMVAALARNAGF